MYKLRGKEGGVSAADIFKQKAHDLGNNTSVGETFQNNISYLLTNCTLMNSCLIRFLQATCITRNYCFIVTNYGLAEEYRGLPSEGGEHVPLKISLFLPCPLIKFLSSLEKVPSKKRHCSCLFSLIYRIFFVSLK